MARLQPLLDLRVVDLKEQCALLRLRVAALDNAVARPTDLDGLAHLDALDAVCVCGGTKQKTHTQQHRRRAKKKKKEQPDNKGVSKRKAQRATAQWGSNQPRKAQQHNMAHSCLERHCPTTVLCTTHARLGNDGFSGFVSGSCTVRTAGLRAHNTSTVYHRHNRCVTYHGRPSFADGVCLVCVRGSFPHCCAESSTAYTQWNHSCCTQCRDPVDVRACECAVLDPRMTRALQRHTHNNVRVR